MKTKESAPFDINSIFEALNFSNPYSLLLDFNEKFIGVGSNYLKASNVIDKGQAFVDIFSWESIFSFANWNDSLESRTYFFSSKDKSQRYKASIKKTSYGFIVVASPIVNSKFHINNYGVTLSDFPKHDHIVEYVFLLQSSSRALDEARNLNEKLLEKNKSIETAKEELISLAKFPSENPNPILRISKNFKLLYANDAASIKFINDFKIDVNGVNDQVLKMNLSHCLKNELENSSIYLKRKERTYLVNIKNVLNAEYFNIYANDISLFITQVEEKEEELRRLTKTNDEQRIFYEYILNNLPSDIAVFSPEHKYLFINPQAIQDKETREFMIGKDDFDYCNLKGIPTDSAKFRRAAFSKVKEGKKEIEWEDELLDLASNRKVVLRKLAPVFDTDEQLRYVVGYGIDVTAIKLSKEILQKNNLFQSILMDMATKYINLPIEKMDATINQSLAQLGNFVQVDRVYIFNYDHEAKTTTNTYEWVAEGISPEIDNLQDIPFEYVPVWIETHFKGENIEVENTFELPEGMFKSLLIEQDIKSLIALPLMLEGKCLGFVGLDSVKNFRKFYREEKDLLQFLARMLVNIDQRIKYTKALEVSNLTIQTMNEDLRKIVQAEKTVNLLADSFMLGADYESICWDIVENVISQLDFEDCVVYQVQGKELVQVAAMGNKTHQKRVLKDAMRIPFGKGIVGAVAKTGESILISDTTMDKRYLVDDQARLSEVAVPIKVGRKVWGVIDSEHEKKDFFTKLHLRVLLTLSNLLSQKIAVLEEQQMKEKLQEEILAINTDLENRVMEETNRNIELTKSMSDQEKLVTLGEIASGIAHDLNTPLGAIKIGAESIRYTTEELLKNIVWKCSAEQIKFACERSAQNQGELFLGGLQLRKEIKEFEDYLSFNFPISKVESTEIAGLFVKSRISLSETKLIKQCMATDNRKDFLLLIYYIQLNRNFIETILSSSERGAKVVQDLRSFIKEPQNKSKGVVNLRENITTVLTIFNYELKRNIDVEFTVPDSLSLLGFDIKLFQLWSNIIKNAVEAMGDKKERGQLKINGKKTKKGIEISIENNGPLIPKQIQQKIFEKYFTTKSGQNGSGLGLSIVKNVLSMHNATISLNSTLASTTFTILFNDAL